MNVNREYKNTVFTRLFSEAGKLIELYNALSGNNYSPDTDIEINTLDDTLYMDMINDVSFVDENKVVVLIEHQSSINENLPLRLLLYMARLYEKMIDKRLIYRQSLMKIPIPEFIVLYNGKAPYPSKKELILSDAFYTTENKKYGGLELCVQVININPGYNEEIVRNSKSLYDYTVFIGKVREGVDSGMNLSAAITEAVKYCETQNILQPFLLRHTSEVINMLTNEFNMEEAIAVWREEFTEIGRQEGRKEGRQEGVEIGEAHVLKLLELGHTADEIKRILRESRNSRTS